MADPVVKLGMVGLVAGFVVMIGVHDVFAPDWLAWLDCPKAAPCPGLLAWVSKPHVPPVDCS